MSGMELWWIGQSGFRLRDPAQGPVLFVDPFLSPHHNRAWQAPVGPEALAHADAVLCTHEHIDHFDRPALQAANQVSGARFQLIIPAPIVPEALDLGIPQERLHGVQPGDVVETGGARVHVVPAKHGISMKDAYTFGKEESAGQVRFLGYVVDLGGVRAYHAGDTIPYQGQVEALRPLRPHLALLPINGRDFFRETERNLVGNINPREAAKLANDIGAEVLVPMHWELFPYNRGFPGDLAADLASEFPNLTLLVFGRGARFTYLPASQTEDQP